jgi:hypothetical protein
MAPATLFWEDIAVDTLLRSSFGAFVMPLFQGLFPPPSWQPFTLLACGWAVTPDRHTITTYLWLTGATTVKHFSRVYVCLGGPLYPVRWQLWAALIRSAARDVPAGEVLVIRCDDTTEKKAGAHIAGRDRSRNGAGSARQEYRTLRGLNFVLGPMCVPLRGFPSPSLSVPIGLARYRKAAAAHQRHVPPRTRSQ